MMGLALLSAVALAGPLVDTVDAELRTAAGGGTTGLWVRGAHSLLDRKRPLRLGVALGAFTGPEVLGTGPARTEGRMSDLHLDAHLSQIFRPGRRDRLALEIGPYLGAMGFRSVGSYRQTDLGVSQEATTNALMPDVGVRMAAGWRVAPAWTVQLSLTDSLRRVGGAQGVMAGLLSMSPDAKLSAGLGVSWRPGPGR